MMKLAATGTFPKNKLRSPTIRNERASISDAIGCIPFIPIDLV